jgi:oligopeptide transport system permease protein
MLRGNDTLPADRYAALLQEAARIHGVSLWQDAWRRLRQNRAAMASLLLLAAIAVLAFATPLLPLQSPRFQRLSAAHQFQRPRLLAVELNLSLPDVQRFERDTAALQNQLASASGEERDRLAAQLAGRAREHPLNRLWTSPGWLTRQFLKLRLAVFGRWCIPSILGTDELEPDMLSRVFWGPACR